MNWTRKQRRTFGRLTSWLKEARGRGCQLVRLDLTTARGGDRKALRKDFKALRRRIERRWGFTGLEYFALDTIEGNGVLHTVLAWDGDKSFYIPQDWLANEWRQIHGAYIVWVRQMGGSKKDIQHVSRYITEQYLSDQKGAGVRMSYSWSRSRMALGKAWEKLRKFYTDFYCDSDRGGWRRWKPYYLISRVELICGWSELLETGQAVIGNDLWECRGRSIEVVL